MSSAHRNPVEAINYWIKYIDCALTHPHPIPKGKHVFRGDLKFLPGVGDLYDCLFKLYSEEDVSKPFREPVNALQLNVFTYFTTVREPMSLRTVLDRIVEGGHYSEAMEVMRDVDLIWSNCVKFNGADSALAADARKCQMALTRLQEQQADEQEVPVEDVNQFVECVMDVDDASLLNDMHQYIEKEDPSLLSDNGELILESIKMKHFKVLKAILEKRTGGGQ